MVGVAQALVQVGEEKQARQVLARALDVAEEIQGGGTKLGR